MTKKHTKRALFASALSMLLCVSMLIGSTFAWFTDTASIGVNKIEAGTLEIGLYDQENGGNPLKTLTFKKATGAEKEAVLFEPGCTYELQQAWLRNDGNLYAKYKVVISGVNGDSKLAEVLTVEAAGVKEGTTLKDLVTTSDNCVLKEGTIAPNAAETFGTIKLHMQESADNTYQGLTMEGITITVYATQASGESDSYGNEYDVNAEDNAVYDEVVFVGSQNGLNDAITNAEGPTKVELPSNSGDGSGYKLPSMTDKDITFTGTKDTVIDMSSAVTAADSAVTFDGVTLEFDNDSYEGLQHSKKEVYKNCTIKGTMFLYAPEVEFINCTFEMADDKTEYSVWTYGAQDVTFTNCTFNTHGKAVLVYTEGEIHANIKLNGCTFSSDGTVASDKAAVEVGSSPNSADTTYNLTFNNCKQTGFAANHSTNALWGNKNDMDKEHLHVVIDDKIEY